MDSVTKIEVKTLSLPPEWDGELPIWLFQSTKQISILEKKVAVLETKMNMIAYIAGATLVTVLGIFATLLIRG